MTFIEYVINRWNREPNDKELNKIVKIIVWNIWQMDGLTLTISLDNEEEQIKQLSLFEENKKENNCVIYDWQKKEKVFFNTIANGGTK